jgi:hypothetical protein
MSPPITARMPAAWPAEGPIFKGVPQAGELCAPERVQKRAATSTKAITPCRRLACGDALVTRNRFEQDRTIIKFFPFYLISRLSGAVRGRMGHYPPNARQSKHGYFCRRCDFCHNLNSGGKVNVFLSEKLPVCRLLFALKDFRFCLRATAQFSFSSRAQFLIAEIFIPWLYATF